MEESEMIARNTSVRVARKPLQYKEKKIWREDRVVKSELAAALVDDVRSGDTGDTPLATEEDRLQQIVDISGNEYGVTNWEKTRYV